MENTTLDVAETKTKKQYVLKPEQHGMIKRADANRIVGENDNHVRKLAQNMKQFGYNPKHPIIVGPDMVIRAGHNRFVAAGLAGVDIVVEVDENEAMSFVEQTKQDDIYKKWTTKDFIRLHAKEGKQAYIDLEIIIRSYSSFPIKIIIASAANLGNQASGDVFDAVRQGNFHFAKGKTRLDVEHEMDEIQDLHDLIPEEHKPQGEISMHVGLAYLWLKLQDDFDKEWFNKNVKRNKTMLVPQAGGTQSNRKMLVSIYNKGLRKPNHISCDI